MNLEQLRKHPSFPFQAFQQNDLEFLLLEMFWVEFFRDCLDTPDQAQDWEPLFPAERDGVPILVVANAKRNRALRIHLRTNEDERPLYPSGTPELPNEYFLPFDLWLDTIRDSTGSTAYPGLVISTDMSAPALDLTRKLVTMLCREEEPAGLIQAWLDNYYEELQTRGFYWK
ncbi:hypothetical protein [Pyxidicoccus xibeiensis]|uniref:hypothetical protein n=1 Tax=Pyxidicoccus xibeiensis TaxID=2906759 RepID=UPI0020A70049|nr:hypothetical protein [Pyxidicoccus xibeiensis]MCP3137833.1 hypothetical protein [Pyxidicoccus xibeiensis]